MNYQMHASAKAPTRRPPTAKRGSSQNALRHGLTTVRPKNPVYTQNIARLADAFCEGDISPPLRNEAVQLAIAQVTLREIRDYKQFLLSRLLNPDRFRTTDRRAAQRYFGRLLYTKYGFYDKTMPVPAPDGPYDRCTDYDLNVKAMLYVPRQRRPDAALMIALPELVRVARYERDAWRIWRRAFRQFLRIKAERTTPAPTT